MHIVNKIYKYPHLKKIKDANTNYFTTKINVIGKFLKVPLSMIKILPLNATNHVVLAKNNSSTLAFLVSPVTISLKTNA